MGQMYKYLRCLLTHFYNDISWFDMYIVFKQTSSAKKQKGVNTFQKCSIENQNGANAIEFV